MGSDQSHSGLTAIALQSWCRVDHLSIFFLCCDRACRTVRASNSTPGGERPRQTAAAALDARIVVATRLLPFSPIGRSSFPLEPFFFESPFLRRLRFLGTVVLGSTSGDGRQ